MGRIVAILDTNVIVRFLTSDKNVKYKGLYRFFESLEQGEIQVELKLEVVACYLVASLESNPRNILYNYDRDFDKFKINRKEP